MVVVSARVHAPAIAKVAVRLPAAVVANTMLARALTKTNHLTRTDSMHTSN